MDEATLTSYLSFSTVTTLGIFFLVAILTRWMYLSYNLPPGPWGIPIFGYLPFFGKETPEVELAKLCNKYGNVMSLYMGNVLVVVLGNYEAIKEGFVKQGENFHGRPLNNVFKTKDEDKGLGVAEGDDWKEQRNFAVSTFRDYGMGKLSLEPRIMEEIFAFMIELAKFEGKPVDVKKLLGCSIANVIASMEFGERFDYSDERLLKLRGDTDESNKLISSMAVRVFFSWTRHIPYINNLTGHTLALKIHDSTEEILLKIVQEHEKNYLPGSRKDYIDAFLTERRNQIKKTGTEGTFDERELIGNLGGFFAAGSETILTVLRWAMVYLMRHPEIQDKVHKEIDDVIGLERIPSLTDRQQMPYAEAVLMELQRCGSVAPLNLVHSNIQETTIFGYRIPKRSHIITNLWAVHNDPTLWKDPEKFNPERFLNDKMELQKPPEYLIPFGIGKRICLGESLARMELFLYFTSLFQRFKFCPPEGKSPPGLDYDFGISRSPKPFETCAVQRSGYQAA